MFITNMIQVYVVVDKETLYMTNSVEPNLFANSDFFGNLNVPVWYGFTKALKGNNVMLRHKFEYR